MESSNYRDEDIRLPPPPQKKKKDHYLFNPTNKTLSFLEKESVGLTTDPIVSKLGSSHIHHVHNATC